MGFFCAEFGSKTPPVVLSSASATLASTRSPFGLTCEFQATHQHVAADGWADVLSVLYFRSKAISSQVQEFCGKHVSHLSILCRHLNDGCASDATPS